MDEFMKNMIEKYLKKYGKAERVCSASDLKGNWEANTYYETIYLEKIDDLTVRDALVGQGRIIEEDLENHVYVDLLRIGIRELSEALLVIKRDDNAIYIATYAKEGLIKQHLAKQAVEKAKLLLTQTMLRRSLPHDGREN